MGPVGDFLEPSRPMDFSRRMVQAPIWSHDEFSKDGPLDLLLGGRWWTVVAGTLVGTCRGG